jgi:hypothetical protein
MLSGMNRSFRPPSDPGSAHVSAAVFLDQKQVAERMLGADVVARAVATLTEAERAELDGLLPMSWMNIGTAYAFHVAVAAQIGEDVIAWHRRLTRVGLEQTFTTLWRFFMKMASVESLVKRASAIYGRSYDKGKLASTLVRPGLLEARLTEWPDIPEFEIGAIVSGIEVLLHLAGRRSAAVFWTRESDGVRFEIRYD